jgi:predicted ATPase/DNA-binding CsgD family transcriptional regulator
VGSETRGEILTVLPAPSGPLIGRAEALACAHEQLGSRRLVTLVGPGGIGKTRLAIEVARDCAMLNRRVGFVELAGVVDAGEVVDTIADQLSVEVVPGSSRYEGLLHWLRAAPTVLVVDNVEHVIDAAPDLRALLDECPCLRILVTSRRALGVADEVVVRVDPLPATAPDGSLSVVAPGVQLLLERSQVAHPTTTDVEEASRIVAGLGGLPLAIELAAVRARALGIAAVHELLVTDIALGGFDGRDFVRADAPSRHGSLRACLQWTYDSLDGRARAVFHATGAFAATFDLAALRAVVGDRREAAAGLATLVEHHLVDRVEAEDGSIRYCSSPPIHEYARERLRAQTGWSAVADAHADWYQAAATQICESFETGSAEAAFASFRREQTNLALAILTRLRSRRYADAAVIACDIARLAAELGREPQTNALFRRLVRLAVQDGSPLPIEARIWAAYAELVTRTPATAGPVLDALIALIEEAREAGDDRAALRGLSRLTASLLSHGDVARALAASGEAIDLATKLRLRWPLAQLLTWHAMLLHVAGDIPGACRYGFDGLRIARELGDGRLIVRIGLLFAPMERTAQMDAEFVPSLHTCLQLAREHGSVIDEMYVTMQLAIRAGFNEGVDVFALARRGLDLADRTRSHGGEMVFVLALAGAAFSRGDDDVAAVLDAALRIEWTALATVMPTSGLGHYEDVAARRRAAVPDRYEQAVAGSTLWADALAVARRYATVDQSPGSHDADSTLTAREREVLREIAAGRTNKEIAQVLGLRPKTVMHHCESIYRKLGVRTRAEATARAMQTGLLDAT